VTLEPNAEAESDYYYFLQDSQEKFIHFKEFNNSNILELTDNYLLAILNVNPQHDTLAGTFKLDGTLINFLLLDISFGTNEFSIERTYKKLNKNTFLISDIRHDTDWILYPTKGINKLTSQRELTISIDKKGFFHTKKILKLNK
jgi:hypothetical protein